MGYEFEISKNASGQFWVRFRYRGDVIFTSETYTSKANALNAIAAAKNHAASAPVEDKTGS